MRTRKKQVIRKILGLASRRREEPDPASPDLSGCYCGSAHEQTRNMHKALKASLRRQKKFGILKIIPNKKRR